MAHDEATNKLTLANLMALLRAGTVEKEAEAVEIAKNILKTKQPPEYTGAGVASEYKTKLLPFTLKEALNNKKYIALYNKPELNPLARDYNASDYLAELQKLQADIFEASELLNMRLELTESKKQKDETDKGNILNSLQTIGKYFVDNMQGVNWDLLPYIVAELDKPGTAEKFRLNAPFETFDTNNPEWLELIEAAKAKKEEATENALIFSDLPQIDKKEKLSKLALTISNVDNEIWEKIKSNDNGQYFFTTNSLPKLTDDDTIFIAADFSYFPLELSKTLGAFERRVWSVCLTYWLKGERKITARQIYKAMGYRDNVNPNARDIKDICDAMDKLALVRLNIDNLKEFELSNGKYKAVKNGKFYLFSNEQIQAKNKANGQIINSAFLFSDNEPFLYTFAKDRKQITTIKQALYRVPIKNIKSNMKLTDCIIFELEQRRKGYYKSNKILYSSLFDSLGGVRSNRQADKIKIIKEILNYYKSDACDNYIKDWKEAPPNEKPGIYVYFTDSLPGA